MRDIGDGQGALRKVFVAAPNRGHARRVASHLLSSQHARERGMHSLLLDTTERYLAAHRFYEKQGVLQVACAALPATFPGIRMDSRFYRLTLYEQNPACAAQDARAG